MTIFWDPAHPELGTVPASAPNAAPVVQRADGTYNVSWAAVRTVQQAIPPDPSGESVPAVGVTSYPDGTATRIWNEGRFRYAYYPGAADGSSTEQGGVCGVLDGTTGQWLTPRQMLAMAQTAYNLDPNLTRPGFWYRSATVPTDALEFDMVMFFIQQQTTWPAMDPGPFVFWPLYPDTTGYTVAPAPQDPAIQALAPYRLRDPTHWLGAEQYGAIGEHRTRLDHEDVLFILVLIASVTGPFPPAPWALMANRPDGTPLRWPTPVPQSQWPAFFGPLLQTRPGVKLLPPGSVVSPERAATWQEGNWAVAVWFALTGRFPPGGIVANAATGELDIAPTTDFYWQPITATQAVAVPTSAAAAAQGNLIGLLETGGRGQTLVMQLPQLVKSGALDSVINAMNAQRAALGKSFFSSPMGILAIVGAVVALVTVIAAPLILAADAAAMASTTEGLAGALLAEEAGMAAGDATALASAGVSAAADAAAGAGGLTGVFNFVQNPFSTLGQAAGLSPQQAQYLSPILSAGKTLFQTLTANTVAPQPLTVPASMVYPNGQFVPTGTVLPAGTTIPAGTAFLTGPVPYWQSRLTLLSPAPMTPLPSAPAPIPITFPSLSPPGLVPAPILVPGFPAEPPTLPPVTLPPVLSSTVAGIPVGLLLAGGILVLLLARRR